MKRLFGKLTSGWPVRLAPQTRLVDWLMHFREGLFLLAIRVVGLLTAMNRARLGPNFEKPHPGLMRLATLSSR